MTYQTNDTQPERSSLAWSRTRWAVLALTLLECRLLFDSDAVVALVAAYLAVLSLGAGVLITALRKRQLRAGLAPAYFPAAQLALLLVQVLVLAALGLVAVFE